MAHLQLAAKSNTSARLRPSRKNRCSAKEGQPIDSSGHTAEGKFVLLIAGANGSGKTTLGRDLVEAGRLTLFLNPDELVESTEGNGAAFTALRAAKLHITQRDSLIARGESFAIETTLSGRSTLSFLRRAKQAGYEMRIAYVFVDNPQLCMDRIALRVRAGGHDVPEDLVRRRFSVSMRHFWNDYRLFADRWTLSYNGDQGIEAIADGKREHYRVLNERLFGRFKDQLS